MLPAWISRGAYLWNSENHISASDSVKQGKLKMWVLNDGSKTVILGKGMTFADVELIEEIYHHDSNFRKEIDESSNS